MTSRERLIAASRGGETDQVPVIAWPIADPASDAVVTISVQPNAEKLVLAEVRNPFGRALAGGIDLNHALGEDPASGDELLENLVQATREEIGQALEAGADGVLYCVHGACPEHCSPMQYGGHYLERDRELLAEVKDAAFNLVFVVGDEEVYIDFVSDLPAHAFGWDAQASGVSVESVRAMRTGALATNVAGAEIHLTTGVSSVARHLENRLAAV